MLTDQFYRMVDDGSAIRFLKPGKPMTYQGPIVAVSNEWEGLDKAMEEYAASNWEPRFAFHWVARDYLFTERESRKWECCGGECCTNVERSFNQ